MYMLPLRCTTIRYSSTACSTASYLLPHMVQLAICCCMPYSLLFVAICCTVCYLLPHAVLFAICCCMPHSLLFVAACRTIYYLLPHAVLFAICCHAAQFAICRRSMWQQIANSTACYNKINSKPYGIL